MVDERSICGGEVVYKWWYVGGRAVDSCTMRGLCVRDAWWAIGQFVVNPWSIGDRVISGGWASAIGVSRTSDKVDSQKYDSSSSPTPLPILSSSPSLSPTPPSSPLTSPRNQHCRRRPYGQPIVVRARQRALDLLVIDDWANSGRRLLGWWSIGGRYVAESCPIRGPVAVDA